MLKWPLNMRGWKEDYFSSEKCQEAQGLSVSRSHLCGPFAPPLLVAFLCHIHLFRDELLHWGWSDRDRLLDRLGLIF